MLDAFHLEVTGVEHVTFIERVFDDVVGSGHFD
jgi:hypothetical protein